MYSVYEPKILPYWSDHSYKPAVPAFKNLFLAERRCMGPVPLGFSSDWLSKLHSRGSCVIFPLKNIYMCFWFGTMFILSEGNVESSVLGHMIWLFHLIGPATVKEFYNSTIGIREQRNGNMLFWNFCCRPGNTLKALFVKNQGRNPLLFILKISTHCDHNELWVIP